MLLKFSNKFENSLVKSSLHNEPWNNFTINIDATFLGPTNPESVFTWQFHTTLDKNTDDSFTLHYSPARAPGWWENRSESWHYLRNFYSYGNLGYNNTA